MFKKELRKLMVNYIQIAADGCDPSIAEKIADQLISIGVAITPQLAEHFDYVPLQCPICGATAFVESGMAVRCYCDICHENMVQVPDELEPSRN